MLSGQINAHILQALSEGPKSLTALRHALASPPATTMRGHLRALVETGVVERDRRDAFPRSVVFELTASGRELWKVAEILRFWLGTAPAGPLSLGSAAAKSAIKALVDGWGACIVRALAAQPLSLTELNGLIGGLSYPSLERRLGAMRMAGQIERTTGPGRSVPYAVTVWLRQAIAPLGAAAQWERTQKVPASAPVRRLDVEAAFLLTLPLLTLPEDLSGACRLAVEVDRSNGRRPAGVVVKVSDGRVISCVANISGDADAWASGTVPAWFGTVIDEDRRRLELGGDTHLARTLLVGLHRALFGTGARAGRSL